MEDKHREILKVNRIRLRRDLEPNKLLPFLVDKTLDRIDEQKIKQKVTREERCDELLGMIPRRGPNAFHEFVEALKKVQPFLADLLKEKEKKGPKKELSKVEEENRELRTELEEVKQKLKKTLQEYEELKNSLGKREIVARVSTSPMQLSQVDSAADFEIQIKLVENESTTGEVLNDTSGDSATVTEERDKSEEWCENLAKQLEEAQVVENLGKQCTSTVKDRVTSPIEGKELESWIDESYFCYEDLKNERDSTRGEKQTLEKESEELTKTTEDYQPKNQALQKSLESVKEECGNLQLLPGNLEAAKKRLPEAQLMFV